MKKKKILVLSVLVVVMMLFSACHSSMNPIVGKWKCGNEYKIFNEDGTYEEGNASVSATGTYVYDGGDKLVTTIYGEDDEYTVAFPKKNQMELTTETELVVYKALWEKYR